MRRAIHSGTCASSSSSIDVSGFGHRCRCRTRIVRACCERRRASSRENTEARMQATPPLQRGRPWPLQRQIRLQMLHATVPLGSMLIATLVGMYLDGKSKSSGAAASILDTLAAADSTAALTWATMLGNLLAVLLPLVGSKLCARGQRTEGGGGATLGSLMGHWVEGVQECVEALVILACMEPRCRRQRGTRHIPLRGVGLLASDLAPADGVHAARDGHLPGIGGVGAPASPPPPHHLLGASATTSRSSQRSRRCDGGTPGNVSSPLADTSV